MILGIDPGKKASAVILDYGGNLVDSMIWNSKYTRFDGQYTAVYHTQRLLDIYQPDIIGIEVPGVSMKSTALLQGFCLGALYHACIKYTTPRLINCRKLHKEAGDKSSISWALSRGYTLPDIKWRADTLADSILIAFLAAEQEIQRWRTTVEKRWQSRS